MSQEFERIVLEKLDKMDAKLDEHAKKIAKNTEEIMGLTEVVKYHTNMITKFDYDFRKKIDTLFDAYNYLNHKIEFDKVSGRILKSEIFQHEVRISSLEDILKKNTATA